MSFSNSFFELASAQNRKLERIQCIVVFPNINEIPQDIIFFPTSIDSTKSLEENIQVRLGESEKIGFILYFQSIRWLEPNLENMLNEMDCVGGETPMPYLMNNPEFRLKVGAGIVTMDTTVLSESTQKDSLPRNFDIKVLNTKYHLKVMDTPMSMGIPKLFEPISLKTK
ncbi:hypothetical protein [Dinghuibacter silviterrae]|nr:hypothetical protein [Dinghuibacter silviterrae]